MGPIKKGREIGLTATPSKIITYNSQIALLEFRKPRPHPDESNKERELHYLIEIPEAMEPRLNDMLQELRPGGKPAIPMAYSLVGHTTNMERAQEFYQKDFDWRLPDDTPTLQPWRSLPEATRYALGEELADMIEWQFPQEDGGGLGQAARNFIRDHPEVLMHYEGEQPLYPHPTANDVLQGLVLKAAGGSDAAITANLTEVEVEQAAPHILPLIMEEVAKAGFNYQDTVEGYLSATIEAVAERVPAPEMEALGKAVLAQRVRWDPDAQVFPELTAQGIKDLVIDNLEPEEISPEQDLDTRTVDTLAPDMNRAVMEAMREYRNSGQRPYDNLLEELVRTALGRIPENQLTAVRRATGLDHED